MNNQKKENRSMYLYTALIFVVALLLILVAFFSQTNISKLGNRANEFATATPTVVQPPTEKPDELAKLANMAAELDSENRALKAQTELADKLFTANAFVANSQFADAESVISEIDAAALDENEKILYDDIINKINEGKGI